MLTFISFQLTAALSPLTLEIYNDSHLHAHHKAMAGNISKETHFRYDFMHSSQNSIHSTDIISRLVIISDVFASKMQPARHRMVYALLRDEMALEGGIHALQLKTLTPEEEKRLQKKKAAEAAAKEKQDTATSEKAESKADTADA